MADQTEESVLSAYVARAFRNAVWATRAWSGVHHSFLFGAAILSAAAALTLQLKTLNLGEGGRADVATGFAVTASLFNVISASGGFSRKWRANRMTKATLEQIEIDLMAPKADLEKIRARLAEMKRVHHLGILGEGEPPKPNRETGAN